MNAAHPFCLHFLLCLSTPSTYTGGSCIMSLRPSAWARQPSHAAWSMERFIVECSITLGCALDASTQAVYSGALNSYLTFCQLHHLDSSPTANTLSLYMTFMSHHIEPHSVCSYLAGIISQLEPSYPSVCANRFLPLVVRTLKGALDHFSGPVCQKSPLTRDDLMLVYCYSSRDPHSTLSIFSC